MSSLSNTVHPTFWGPTYWNFFNLFAVNYPRTANQRQQVDCKHLFHIIINNLPCDECKQHANQYLQKNPIDKYVQGRLSLIQWIVDFHNTVSRRLDKQQEEWTIQTFETTFGIDLDNSNEIKQHTKFIPAVPPLLGMTTATAKSLQKPITKCACASKQFTDSRIHEIKNSRI